MKSRIAWKHYASLKTKERCDIFEKLLESNDVSKHQKEDLVFAIDYDSCLDLLQTSRVKGIRELVFSKDGVAGKDTKFARHLLWAHFLLRAILEHLSQRYNVTMLNSSLDQSKTRTDEVARIARSYKLAFKAVRNSTRSKTHPLCKLDTHVKQRKFFASETLFVFLDDLKTNVNAVNRAKRNTVAAVFDYMPMLNGRESITKFTGTLLSSLHRVLDVGFVKKANNLANEYSKLK